MSHHAQYDLFNFNTDKHLSKFPSVNQIHSNCIKLLDSMKGVGNDPINTLNYTGGQHQDPSNYFY